MQVLVRQFGLNCISLGVRHSRDIFKDKLFPYEVVMLVSVFLCRAVNGC